MHTPMRDRVAAGIGTVLVVGALGAALVAGLTVDLHRIGQTALAVFDVVPPAPPPPPPPEPVHRSRAAEKASPRNLRNKATAVVAPPPIVIPPKPPPLVVAPKAGIGMAAQTGASARPGPGQGAGGRGDGTGGGGDGGDGDGDDTPPVQVAGRLRSSDLPSELRAPGARYAMTVRYRVGIDGRVGECAIRRSSGNAMLDARVCDLIRRRYRFRPALDPDGRPIDSTFVENAEFGVDREDIPADPR